MLKMDGYDLMADDQRGRLHKNHPPQRRYGRVGTPPSQP